MHPHRSPFDTTSAARQLTRAVGRALNIPRTKWAPIRAAIEPEVKRIAETSRRSMIRTAVSRRAVRSALADIL